ncbi:MAG: histone deacetylase family protein [bacterium]
MKLIWSPHYNVNLFGHVFPSEKYVLIRKDLLSRGIFRQEDFIEARMPLLSDILLVHTREYIEDLRGLRLSERTYRSELPLTEEIVNAHLLMAGGTCQASEIALKEGICVHLGGGFHHAYDDHAEGFCYINDTAVAAARLMQQGIARKVIIIDCDLHQGNGTAFIFRDQPDVFTFSIHQENNYPIKERSDLDIGLPDGAEDQLYLDELRVVSEILKNKDFEVCFYLAGADPYLSDRLGGLAVSKEGLMKRDEFVIGECFNRSIPVCILLAGGYAQDVMDVVDIHVNTVLVAKAYHDRYRTFWH